MALQTDQEVFWAGDFGTAYTQRSQSAQQLSTSLLMLSRALTHAPGIASVLELGANVGVNLSALSQILPRAELHGVEINANAVAYLATIPNVTAYLASLLDFKPPRRFDLAFTSGVLIHIAPERLPDAYDALYRASSRYILVNEYYSPRPEAIPYRGHEGKLFKRDFAGEMLEAYPDLRLIDYGFIYARDPMFPLKDETNWFLMQKV